jgi:hypothetical protein
MESLPRQNQELSMSSTSEQQDVVNGESSSREEGGFFDLGS